ncbi:MAG TPA: hypothetical protein IAA63_09435 [Candidatus Pullilachnospira stercoravium]|uniref:ABC-2 family transporter protein n=1 Tax=Candidatus Pullilachnospira stercoravium TaxID=2840913 RepID=A0A9D1NWH6_9FIRM|nr:hypothetical protein [Candidatus Pullilachnospira stercoravium]
MKRKWEKQLQVQLKRYYEAPPPQKKSEFFSSCPETVPAGMPKMRSLLWIQAGYIRKWSWGISLIIFLAGIWAAESGRRELFQTLAAMMPFLALALTTETGRSARCNMEELELSCRFSLKTVVAARMGILGLENLLLLGLLIPVLGAAGEMGFWQTGCALLIPYFLTAFLQMAVVRKLRGQEGIYACFGIAVLVSGLTAVGVPQAERLAENFPAVCWVAITAILAALALREGIQYMRQTEEYVWN